MSFLGAVFHGHIVEMRFLSEANTRAALQGERQETSASTVVERRKKKFDAFSQEASPEPQTRRALAVDLLLMKKNAQQVGTANDGICHVACYRMSDRRPITESKIEGCTRRASSRRG